MNKEEILEKSRNENLQKDPYEMEINLKASNIGLMCGIILCFILFLIQIFCGLGCNYGLWSIIASVNAGAGIYKGIKLSNRNSMLLGVCYLLGALLGATAFVYSMI